MNLAFDYETKQYPSKLSIQKLFSFQQAFRTSKSIDGSSKNNRNSVRNGTSPFPESRSLDLAQEQKIKSNYRQGKY